MSVPAFIETGTADILPGFIGDWRLHTASFSNAPAGNKWLIAGTQVDRYFGGLICRLTDGDHRQRPALDACLKLSLDFLDAYGRRNRAALNRLTLAAALQPFAPLVEITKG